MVPEQYREYVEEEKMLASWLKINHRSSIGFPLEVGGPVSGGVGPRGGMEKGAKLGSSLETIWDEYANLKLVQPRQKVGHPINFSQIKQEQKSIQFEASNYKINGEKTTQKA